MQLIDVNDMHKLLKLQQFLPNKFRIEEEKLLMKGKVERSTEIF
jgi:hypothetical protein